MFKFIVALLVTMTAAYSRELIAKQVLARHLPKAEQISLQRLQMRLQLCQPRVCNKCIKIIHNKSSTPKLVSFSFFVKLIFPKRNHKKNIFEIIFFLYMFFRKKCAERLFDWKIVAIPFYEIKVDFFNFKNYRKKTEFQTRSKFYLNLQIEILIEIIIDSALTSHKM